jgi:uncharacterized protein YcsI (UPF0317 family)
MRVDGASRPALPDARQSLATGIEARYAARHNRAPLWTAGLAPGYVQGNLAIVPAEFAPDFLRFCHLNPKPCPLIGMSEPGSPHIPALGGDLDLRTDLPLFRVWRDGELAEEPTEVTPFWRDDLVGFVLGCSLSFEEALLQEGLPIRHVETGARVPMYRTNIACAPAGRFAGPMVVSMRPFTPAHAIRAVQITSRFPAVHGAPIHIGLPEQIGIGDLSAPDYGDPVEVGPEELPVFWACGVTPQAVIEAARLPFAITHAPGSMLVTDLKNAQLAAF